jgi:3(or 17)beta-hydroxysteroid dehydrogenase
MAAFARKALGSLSTQAQGGLAHVTRGPVQGKPQDIANLVLFLASDESIGINGSSMVVDNGETLK